MAHIDDKAWDSMMGNQAMEDLLLSGDYPWLNRAVENPARLETEWMDQNGYTWSGESSILTAVSTNAETGIVMVYPTIRMIDGELKELSGVEAKDKAMELEDYIEVPNEEMGNEISKGISNWLERQGEKNSG